MKKIKILVIILVLAGIWGFSYYASNNSSAQLKNIATDKPIVVSEDNFQSEVLNSDIPVVVDFWAAWCGPCKKLSPIYDELSNEYAGKIKFCKLNVDENDKLTAKYEINAIPHLIIFKDGKPVKHIIGLQSKSELESQLDAAIN